MSDQEQELYMAMFMDDMNRYRTALEEIVILAHDHNEPFSSKRAAAAIKEGGK